MISITIPGFKQLEPDHLVLDYNGTLAVDGTPVSGVIEMLQKLSDQITIHVLTADTFGTVRKKLEGVPCTVSVLEPDQQARGKQNYVKQLGEHTCISIGNGRNDCLMLEDSALGIAVIQKEGAAGITIQSADIICTGILDALELLINPLRLTATLRQ